MICPECKNDGVWVDMTFTPGYYYCRTCKDEIGLKVAEYVNIKPIPNPDMDLLEEFERLITENKKDDGIDFILTNITIEKSEPEDEEE